MSASQSHPSWFSGSVVNWKSAGLLVPGLLLFSAAPAYAHHVEKRFKVEAHPVITIHNPNGTITVKAWTKAEVFVSADHDSADVEVDVQTASANYSMDGSATGAMVPVEGCSERLSHR